ncbi:ATP-binding protein [Nocardioides nanhaiensis]|uniref:histidine kinase n=1 Tax=Nocardioides nanhaiensis TaxID=1476871 RepID=A0ABP8VZ37_9ACTN
MPPAPTPGDGPGDLAPAWLLRAVPDGLWMFDDEGRTTYANEQMAELLGIHPDQTLGYSVFDALDEQGAADFRTHLAARRTPGGLTATNLVCLLLRPDGSWVWTLVSHRPVIDDDGAVRGWLYRVKDHTQTRALLGDLEDRERKLVEAQEIARIGSWDADLLTGIATWSPETYRLCGVTPATFEPSARAFAALFRPEDTARLEDAWSRVTEGEPIELDVQLPRPDGRDAWLRVRGVVTADDDGVPVRVGGTVQDVTAATEHRQGLEFLSRLAVVTNRAHSLREVLGSFEDAVGEYSRWTGLLVTLHRSDGTTTHLEPAPLPPDVRARCEGLADRAAAESTVVHDAAGPAGPAGASVLVAGPVRVRDRVVCTVVSDTHTSAVPQPSDLGVFTQLLALLAGVAEREQAERALAGARDEALSASRAKSEFLATMSHEIRTPLNGVIGLGELLRRTALDDHQRRLAEGIDASGRTLLSLVNDVLDLSKVEAGRLELEVVDFDPRRVVEQSVALVADQARDRGLALRVLVEGDTPALVRGDPVRFGQVVTNLAANAVKFTLVGHVEVHVRAASGPRGEQPDGTGVHVEVRDTGVGIAEEARERLFQPFVQADSSTTREFGGTGLGLAISHRIVEALGGRIEVASTPGRGSSFAVTVPFAPAVDLVPLPGHARLVAGARALVVDEDADERAHLVRQLATWQVVARGVATGAECLATLDAAHARGEPLEVVLLSQARGDAGEAPTCRAVRSDPRHTAVRLALVCAPADRGEAAALVEEGVVDGQLARPVLPSALHELLAVLTGRALPRAAQVVADGAAAAAPPVRGRVLVVEDNPVNQLVAEGLVRRLGFAPVVAENGSVAVAAVADEPAGFAAVLMDCQMPVMDGYDATRAIRALQAGGTRTPIVAMTAATVAEERARCLAAGMDDFVPKPVDPDLLAATLTRWTGPPPATTATTACTAAASSPPAESRWERLLELREVDDALVLRMLERWHQTATSAPDRLRRAAEAGDPEELAAAAHWLKGSAGTLGLTEVAALADATERGAVQGAIEPSPTALVIPLSELEAALARSCRELEEFAAVHLT